MLTEEVKYRLMDPSEVGRTIPLPWAVEEQVLYVQDLLKTNPS